MKQNTLLTTHLLTIGLFSILAYNNYQSTSNNCTTSKYKPIIQPSSYEINGIDTKLIEAMIAIESAGNTRAIGKAGEIGLLQVTAKYHLKRCNLKSANQLFEPHHNINCGTEVLKHYLKHSNNNIREALARYNGGFSYSKQSYLYADRVLNKFVELS